MDSTESLGISQSNLERNKFCFPGYCFALKAKQIVDEANVMGTVSNTVAKPWLKVKKHDLMKSMM